MREMTDDSRTRLAITMGEPAGIGAEIIVKALSQKDIYIKCIPVVIGDRAVLDDSMRICRLKLGIREIDEPEAAAGDYGVVELINLGCLSSGDWTYKKNTALGGHVSYAYVTRAIQFAKEQRVDAVVTAPISKESLHLAGFPYNGHTEIFAEQTGTKDFAMLLASKKIHVIHVSTHVSLREACDNVKKERVLEVIRLADRGMRQLGYKRPHIAVAGLNPHCSENGLFGDEEEKEIIPAVEAARQEGLNVSGPLSPDTVFVQCMAGQYDVVVAMYHDQGHIPLKLTGFEYDLEHNRYRSVNGINVTIGLPIIRTSVDHGTAFGKAGEGRANPDSMLDAIDAAVRMVENQTSAYCT